MSKWIAVFTACFAMGAQADSCEFQKEIDESLDLSGSDSLSIAAAAGELDIRGTSGSDQARIRGRVCVSEEQWLDQSNVSMRSGRNAEIGVVLPDIDGGFSVFGSRYAYIDLEIDVPDTIALNVRDSSGDLDIQNVASLELQDSSGDIDIDSTTGSVSIQDSSGDIDAQYIGGTFTIVSDSSGDIYVTDVEQDVIVERDSSGDITAEDVGGNFAVLRDSSGDIDSKRISGDIDIPENKS